MLLPMEPLLAVERDGDIIVVSGDFCAVYYKANAQPQIKLRLCTPTDDHALLARSFQAAVSKARELGWVV